MSEKQMTLRKQLEAFERGEILGYRGEIDDKGCWNFYDWFCNNTSLKNKAKRLMGYTKRFVKAHPELDIDAHHVWFKNNCPMNGPLYDDIRITENKEDGQNVWVITPKSGHTGKAELHHYSNFQKPILEGAKFADLLAEVKVETLA